MKASENRKEIIEKLKTAAFMPYNVIGILENRDHPVYYDASTQTVWAENAYFNYITGDASVIHEKMNTLEDGFYGFSAVESELAQAIYQKYFLHWYEPTERYVFKGEVPDIESPYPVVSIPLEEAKGIDDRYEYQQEGSFEKIKDAIQNRPTSAIYLNDVISSYVLVHEDNSIGYMFTSEEHRHKGLGYWVTLDILRKMQALNQVPFVEINEKNIKSQGLAKKSGFEKDAFTPWFGIIKGVPKWFEEWDPLEGKSYFFTSMANLKYVDHVQSKVKEIKFDKIEKDYHVRIQEPDLKADFHMILDESNEAYLFKSDEGIPVQLSEIICALAEHFPDHNVSFIFPYDESLPKSFTGIFIQK